MQPDDSIDSMVATKSLMDKGICLFDLTLSSPRLGPLGFNSRANKPHEKHYHSFVGEVGCGRWGISTNCRYLLGHILYRIRDCSAMKEIL